MKMIVVSVNSADLMRKNDMQGIIVKYKNGYFTVNAGLFANGTITNV